MTYIVTSSAQADLDALWYHIVTESGSVGRPDQFLDRLKERFEMLSDFPQAGSARDDLGAGRRIFPVADYLIVYRLDGRDVLILRAVHGRRDLPDLLAP